MENNKYNEYFVIDEGYWPEITEQSIKKDDWRKTFPHKTFIELLKATERMLARGSNKDKKGIWIEGTYGTGKSRVAWTLKSILDCPSEDLVDYFAEYPALGKELEMRDRLLTHKKDKIITAHRFSSGGIMGDRALVAAVYDSISKALRDAKVAYKGEDTLRGGIAEWLSDDVNKVFFNTLIALPEYRGLGSFAGKSVDDIINRLKNPNVNVDALISDIFTIADDRGVTALNTDMDKLIKWLEDVITKNNCKIVLVWDEFSDYLKQNKFALSEFQKLLHLSETVPFYLMIVTHMSGSILPEGKDGANIRDRFIPGKIELPDSIAFELISHALKVKDAAKDDWVILSDDLASRTPFSRQAVSKIVKVNDDVLMGMLPIHPFAALLLKYISNMFASNQRSMFNFIKNAETENLQAFQWYIDNFSPQNADILSIDYLWNFFYEKGTDEYGSGAGRSNLDSIIRTILDTFPKNEGMLTGEEKRVLKTVLMMQAISQKLGDGMELFLTNEQNINLAFEGTDLEDMRAVNLAKKLVRDGILYAKPVANGKVQYAAAAVSGDQAQIDALKKRIEKEIKTASLLSWTNEQRKPELFSDALSLTASLRFRYEIAQVTADNFTPTINKITNEAQNYKIRAVMAFARTDDEQSKIRELIKGAIKDDRYSNLVFIDASSTVMGKDRFEQYIDCAANEEYWRQKDRSLSEEMARKAKTLLEDWRTDITNNSLVVYSAYAKSGEPYLNAGTTLAALVNTVLKKYPLSFDNAKVNDNVFLLSALPSGAKFGIGQVGGGVFNIKEISELLKGAWQVPDYLQNSPMLTISKLKKIVDELCETAFERDGRIAIGDIFDSLMEQGFMPCNLYAFLTGFLLKEYSIDTYRYGDGDAAPTTGADKLGEIIGEYIKHKNTPISRYKDKYIEVMTKEQMAFITLTKALFGITNNLSVEQTAARIRIELKKLDYPIWCLKEIDTNGLDEFIDKFSAIANSDNTSENVSKTATALGKMYINVPTAADNLSKLFKKESTKAAMEEFLSTFENGDILTLASKINVQDVLLDVRRQLGHGEALWLWDKDTGEDELRKLLTDYKIVDKSNLLNPKTNSLSSCMQEWREKVKFIKIPVSTLVSEVPSLKTFLLILRDVVTSGDLPYDKRLAFLAELEHNREAFSDFFLERIDVFKNVYSYHLTGFSESEIATLYTKLPTNMFCSDKAECEKSIATLAEKSRGEQEKHKLHQLWDGQTKTKSPKDWSSKNRTPILALVPSSIQADARRAFDAINRNNPEEKDVIFALEFLETKATFLADLSDEAKITAAFIRDITGKFVAVLPNADEVRSQLEKVVPVEPYDWYGNPSVLREVEKFARARYNQGGSERALKKIEKMDDRKAKEYLGRLIKDNMNVGIEIISEGGDEF